MTRPSLSRIIRLNDGVASRLQSSKHITSLTGVIIALLENSLDARSRKLEVTVDWPRGSCVIQDDGHGISPVELSGDGSIGQLYCTSKRQPDGSSINSELETHGTNGTFLAELSSISMFSITSKCLGHDEIATLTLHHGSIVSRKGQASPSGESPFPVGTQHGTLVTIRDLFGGMPVRVKQRALAGLDEQKLWHDLKHDVLALLLAWPHPCIIRLRDVHSDARVLTLASYSPSSSFELTKKNLSHLAGDTQKFDLRDVLSLLFQTGFASPESRNNWVPLSASTNLVSLKGLISLEPAPTKQCQFISIGIHPCNRAAGYSELYDAVNRMFQNSDFGDMEHSAEGDAQEHRDGVPVKTITRAMKRRRARKGIDRSPMFCFQITFKRGAADTPIENLSDTLLAAVVSILETVTWSWLERNRFRPTKRRKLRNDQQKSPSISKLTAAMPDGDLDSQPHPISGNAMTNGGAGLKTINPSLQRSNRKSLEQSAAVNSSILSHIRVGSAHSNLLDQRSDPRFADTRAVSRSETWHDQLPRSSAHGPTGELSDNTSFDMPAIEIEEFGKVGDVSLSKRISRDHSVLTLPAISEHDSKNVPFESHASNGPIKVLDASSDAYGSIDDNDLIRVVENVEHSRTNEADSQLGDQCIERVQPFPRRLRISSKTGVVAPQEEHISAGCEPSRAASRQHLEAIGAAPPSLYGRPIRLVERIGRENRMKPGREEIPSRWLPEFLTSWNNPIFVNRSKDFFPIIPVNQGSSFVTTRQDHHANTATGTEARLESTGTSTIKLSKTVLRDVEAISQVDRKFILCKLKNASNMPDGRDSFKDRISNEQILILIDQHAASERILVEKLLYDFVDDLGINLAERDTSDRQLNVLPSARKIQFDVSQTEFDLFSRYRDHFTMWGVRYDVIEPRRAMDEQSCKVSEHRGFRIVVKSLPAVIAERCTDVPKLCIDMMRAEVWALTDGSKRPIDPLTLHHNGRMNDSTSNDDGPVWLRYLPACPRGILDLISSRACRSAVMFNDPLTLPECGALVTELGNCTFPFVCAHGRVSMVPLAQLDNSDEADSAAVDHRSTIEEAESGDSTAQKSLGASLKAWMSRNSRKIPE